MGVVTPALLDKPSLVLLSPGLPELPGEPASPPALQAPSAAAPPPLPMPCKPVHDQPPPGVFLTAEALRQYSVLDWWKQRDGQHLQQLLLDLLEGRAEGQSDQSAAEPEPDLAPCTSPPVLDCGGSPIQGQPLDEDNYKAASQDGASSDTSEVASVDVRSRVEAGTVQSQPAQQTTLRQRRATPSQRRPASPAQAPPSAAAVARDREVHEAELDADAASPPPAPPSPPPSEAAEDASTRPETDAHAAKASDEQGAGASAQPVKPPETKARPPEELPLCVALNPNNPAYDPAFAAAYRAQKALEARRRRAAAARPRRTSILTAEDHAWYLAHQGKVLRGVEKDRFEALGQRVAVEREHYAQEQWAAGTSQPERYAFCEPRAKFQMEADAAAKRERVRRYSRLHRLHAVLPVPDAGSAAASKEAPVMVHLQRLLHSPAAHDIVLPRGRLTISLERQYLPASRPAAAGETDNTLPEVSGDPCAAKMLGAGGGAGGVQAAVAASAFTCLMTCLPPAWEQGWEIPVLVQADAAGTGGKHIFLDKPLLKRVEDLREKHTRLYKHALTSLSVQPGPGLAVAPAELDAAAAPGATIRLQAGTEALHLAALDATAMELDSHDQQPPSASLAEGPASSIAPSQQAPAKASGAFAQSPPTAARMTRRQTRSAAAAAASAAERADPAAPSSTDVDDAVRPESPGAPEQNAAAQGAPSVGSEGAPSGTDWAALAAAGHGGGALQVALAAATANALASFSIMASEGAAAGADLAPAAAQSPPLAAGDGVEETGRAGPGSCAAAGVSYDAWQFGRFRVVVRSRDVGRAAGGGGAVVRCKAEYLPEQGLEQVTPGEAAAWWSALHLCPGATLLVGRVGVAGSVLLKAEQYSMQQLLQQGGRRAFQPETGYRLLAGLLEALAAAPAGRYLLAHAPGDRAVACFRAMPELAEVQAQPLPCSPALASASDLYDLHAAHASSGAIDVGALPYVPPIWRPYSPTVPQIPYTFPVRLPGDEKDGKRGGEVGEEKAGAKKRRLRKMLPSAWQQLGGVEADWDKQQAARGAQFSRDDYAAMLAQDGD